MDPVTLGFTAITNPVTALGPVGLNEVMKPGRILEGRVAAGLGAMMVGPPLLSSLWDAIVQQTPFFEAVGQIISDTGLTSASQLGGLAAGWLAMAIFTEPLLNLFSRKQSLDGAVQLVPAAMTRMAMTFLLVYWHAGAASGG